MKAIIISFIFSAFLAIVPWFFPNIPLLYKVITVLIAFIITFSVVCYALNKQIKVKQKELESLKEKHNALSAQFDISINKLDSYEAGIKQIGSLLNVAHMVKEEDRFDLCYRCFLEIYASFYDKK